MNCYFTDKSITILPGGDIVPCCRFSTKNHKDDVENIKNIKNIEQDISSFKINKTLKKSFKDNKWPAGCQRCKIDEELNIVSRRQAHANDERIFIDLAIGNFCNLKCIMCSASFSTQWMSDQQFLVDNGFRNSYANTKNINNTIISKESIDKVVSWIKIKEADVDIEIKGGEPLALSITEYFLKELAKLQNQITVVLVTNGTFFPDWLPKIAEKIHLKLSISIDGLHDVYDYVRGTDKYNFSLFDQNVQKFTSISYQYLQFNFVIQNSNVHNYHDCIEYYNRFYINPIFLRSPPWLQVWNMPEESKDLVLKDLERIPLNYRSYQKIQSIIDNIKNKCNQQEYRSFIKFAALLDSKRNKNLPSIAPHLFTSRSLKEYYKIKHNATSINS